MQEVKKWLEKAGKDLRTAKVNLENNEFEAAAFFAHQSAEKALKALFILKFKRLWKIHDLKQLADKVNASKKILEICDQLNPHYIQTRYPVDFTYTRGMTEKAIKDAEKVLEWTKKKIKK